MRRIEDGNGRYALVTGASSGMGYRYAEVLAMHGYNLMIVSNREAELSNAASLVSSRYGVKVIPFFLDLCLEESVDILYDYCVSSSAVPYVLVNNAGIFSHADFGAMSESRISAMIDLHVKTPTVLIRRFAELMVSNGGGHILNMSSMAAYMSFPGISMYTSTKAYLRNLSIALWYEYRHSGLSVTVVCPGAVATDLYGLSARYQKLGISLGIIARPEKIVEKALRASFSGRRVYVPYPVPNRIFIAFMMFMPSCVVRMMYRMLGPLRGNGKGV